MSSQESAKCPNKDTIQQEGTSHTSMKALLEEDLLLRRDFKERRLKTKTPQQEDALERRDVERIALNFSSSYTSCKFAFHERLDVRVQIDKKSAYDPASKLTTVCKL